MGAIDLFVELNGNKRATAKELVQIYPRCNLSTQHSLLHRFLSMGEAAAPALPIVLEKLYQIVGNINAKYTLNEVLQDDELYCKLLCLDEAWSGIGYLVSIIDCIPALGPPPVKDAPAVFNALTTIDGENHLFDITPAHLLFGFSWHFLNLHAEIAMRLMDHPQTRFKVLPLLIKHMSHPNEHVRRWVAELLGDYGEDGKSALPSLIHALRKDKYYRVRYYSAQSISRIRPRGLMAWKAKKALQQALADPDRTVKQYAREALVGMGR